MKTVDLDEVIKKVVSNPENDSEFIKNCMTAAIQADRKIRDEKVIKSLNDMIQNSAEQSRELSLSANPNDWITSNALQNVRIGITQAKQKIQTLLTELKESEKLP